MTNPLGRRTPTDWEHVDRYPMTAIAYPEQPIPVVIGVNWYSNFDHPVWEGPAIGGHYWIGRGDLGRVRGGHCVCLKHKGGSDPTAWWSFYDQGSEGACVGYGTSRMMSLLNRRRYFARWLWDRAKETDEWAETNPGDDEGTSVSAALDILRKYGHVPYNAQRHDEINRDGHLEDWGRRAYLTANPADGIAANRWARSVDTVLDVLGYTGLDYCDVLNSWGRSYPHLVRIPADTLQRLLNEDGEFGLVVDR